MDTPISVARGVRAAMAGLKACATSRSLKLGVAVVLLDVSLTFENVWPTPAVRWVGGMSIELAVFVLVLMAANGQLRPPSRRAIGWLSVMWTVLVLGRYADVTAPALYGREISLYWDLRFMPDVAAMITRVTPVWALIVSIGAIALLLLLLYRVLRWALTVVCDAMTIRGERRVVLVAAIAVLLLFTADRLSRARSSWVFREEYRGEARRLFPAPVTSTYAHQLRLAAGALAPSTPLAASPPMDSDFSRVKGADVFVVFVESYGAVAYERPELAAPLAASRAQLASAIRDTNRSVVSAFVESPTYGASSWLAHVSLLSGVEVRDAGTNARLLAERRDTLVRAFGRQGFRTVALMPGLRGPWPESRFYGFDEIYGANRIAYSGPEFGWFAVPDQFSLDRLDALEGGRSPRAPLFVFFPTISPHFPFSPTPPYQPDWRRLSTTRPYDGPDIVRAYAHEPDWVHFAPGYVDAITYDLASIAGYLRHHATRDLVMIVLGDHQPPALVSGAGASWDVPVHVVASRSAVLERLVSSGFQKGLSPSRPAIGRMHALLPLMLGAFGGGHGQPAPDNVPSKTAS